MKVTLLGAVGVICPMMRLGARPFLKSTPLPPTPVGAGVVVEAFNFPAPVGSAAGLIDQEYGIQQEGGRGSKKAAGRARVQRYGDVDERYGRFPLRWEIRRCR